MKNIIKIKHLGLQPYIPIWQTMKNFTYNREPNSVDEIWLLEHEPIYTQGQAGKTEHILNPGSIPVIKSDRGGQVTYHGPGQLIVYFLIDIARKKLNIREFIDILEKSIIELLASQHIEATTRKDAPGVYVNQAKICSLGLRLRHGRTYHGLSLNVAMDLEPFSRINPCGFSNMQMTQIKNFQANTSTAAITMMLSKILINNLDYVEVINGK